MSEGLKTKAMAYVNRVVQTLPMSTRLGVTQSEKDEAARMCFEFASEQLASAVEVIRHYENDDDCYPHYCSKAAEWLKEYEAFVEMGKGK